MLYPPVKKKEPFRAPPVALVYNLRNTITKENIRDLPIVVKLIDG